MHLLSRRGAKPTFQKYEGPTVGSLNSSRGIVTSAACSVAWISSDCHTICIIYRQRRQHPHKNHKQILRVEDGQTAFMLRGRLVTAATRKQASAESDRLKKKWIFFHPHLLDGRSCNPASVLTNSCPPLLHRFWPHTYPNFHA